MSKPRLETKRLVVGAHRPGDAASLFAYRRLPEVAHYLSWVPESVGEAERFLVEQEAREFGSPGGWHQLAIHTRDGGTLVGDIGLRFLEDPPHQAEIGFTLSPEHQGRGYATEAVEAVLDHGFRQLGLHRVYASVDPRNGPSLALLERLGLRREAHFRQSLWWKGAWVDDVIYALLAEEHWAEKSSKSQ